MDNAPRMITVLVTVQPHEPGLDRNWLVNSVVDGEVDPYWTIETVPDMQLAGFASVVARQRREIAVLMHLARTHRDHRVAKLGRASRSEDADLKAEQPEARAYRAELRLIARS